jgi:hypothetical protein
MLFTQNPKWVWGRRGTDRSGVVTVICIYVEHQPHCARTKWWIHWQHSCQFLCVDCSTSICVCHLKNTHYFRLCAWRKACPRRRHLTIGGLSVWRICRLSIGRVSRRLLSVWRVCRRLLSIWRVCRRRRLPVLRLLLTIRTWRRRLAVVRAPGLCCIAWSLLLLPALPLIIGWSGRLTIWCHSCEQTPFLSQSTWKRQARTHENKTVKTSPLNTPFALSPKIAYLATRAQILSNHLEAFRRQQTKSHWKKERRRRKINPPIAVSSGSRKQKKKLTWRNQQMNSQPPPQNYPTRRNLIWSKNASPSLFSSTKSPVKQTVYQTLLQRGRSDLLIKHSLQYYF